MVRRLTKHQVSNARANLPNAHLPMEKEVLRVITASTPDLSGLAPPPIASVFVGRSLAVALLTPYISLFLLIPFCGHDRKTQVPNQMHKTDPLLFFNALVGVPPSREVFEAIWPSQQKGLRDADISWKCVNSFNLPGNL